MAIDRDVVVMPRAVCWRECPMTEHPTSPARPELPIWASRIEASQQECRLVDHALPGAQLSPPRWHEGLFAASLVAGGGRAAVVEFVEGHVAQHARLFPQACRVRVVAHELGRVGQIAETFGGRDRGSGLVGFRSCWFVAHPGERTHRRRRADGADQGAMGLACSHPWGTSMGTVSGCGGMKISMRSTRSDVATSLCP